MYCQECGKEIGDKVAFCPSCGKPIGNAGDARKKSMSVGKIIGIVIIIILIAIVAILVVRKTTNKASDTEGSTTNEVTDIDKSTTKEVPDTAGPTTDEVTETAEPITKVSALNDIIGDWEPWWSSTMSTGSSTGSITDSYAWSYERPGLLRVEAEGITGMSPAGDGSLYYAIGVDDITVEEENGIKYYTYSAEAFSIVVNHASGMGRHKIQIRLYMDEETGWLICEFNTPLDGSWILVDTYAPAEYVTRERQRIQREREEREERERELSVLNGIVGEWMECFHTESNTYADIYDEIYERVTFLVVDYSFLQAFNSTFGVCYAVEAEDITIQEENGIKYYIYPAEMYSSRMEQTSGSGYQIIDVRLHLDEETGWLICEYNTPQDGFWQQVGAFERLE